MRLVIIDDLQPGMILAKPAINTKNQVLLGAGMALTAKHIEVLRNYGVEEVTIEGDTLPEAPVDPHLLEQVECAMRPAFSRTNLKHPAMQEIYRLSLNVRLRRMQRGGAP